MKFEFFIASKYLFSKRRSLFVSLLLFISLTAVSVGVFALIFVLSIMNGFEGDFQKRVLGFRAPLIIQDMQGRDLSEYQKDLQNRDDLILRASPVLEGEAVMQSSSGGTLGVRVRGISEKPTEERLGHLLQTSMFEEDSVIVGEELASTLHVHPDFLEKIRLIFPLGDVGPAGDLLPRVRSFTLTGMFRSGYYEFDSKYVLVPYSEALKLFGQDARTGLEVWLKPGVSLENIKQKLSQNFLKEGMTIQTWQDQNPKLFAALKLEKIGMFLLLSSLLLIASFTIFGVLSLTVMDKLKDMAILITMGLTPKRVRNIFLSQAFGIGFLGSVFGGSLAITVCWLLKKYPFQLPTTYYLEYLPIRMEVRDVVLILMMAPLLSLLSALYPARQAAQGSPVEVLRHE